MHFFLVSTNIMLSRRQSVVLFFFFGANTSLALVLYILYFSFIYYVASDTMQFV